MAGEVWMCPRGCGYSCTKRQGLGGHKRNCPALRDEKCNECGNGLWVDPNYMLICEGCDNAYHAMQCFNRDTKAWERGGLNLSEGTHAIIEPAPRAPFVTAAMRVLTMAGPAERQRRHAPSMRRATIGSVLPVRRVTHQLQPAALRLRPAARPSTPTS